MYEIMQSEMVTYRELFTSALIGEHIYCNKKGLVFYFTNLLHFWNHIWIHWVLCLRYRIIWVTSPEHWRTNRSTVPQQSKATKYWCRGYLCGFTLVECKILIFQVLLIGQIGAFVLELVTIFHDTNSFLLNEIHGWLI